MESKIENDLRSSSEASIFQNALSTLHKHFTHLNKECKNDVFQLKSGTKFCDNWSLIIKLGSLVKGKEDKFVFIYAASYNILFLNLWFFHTLNSHFHKLND